MPARNREERMLARQRFAPVASYERNDDQSFLFVGLTVNRNGGRSHQEWRRRSDYRWRFGTMSMIPMGGHIIRPNPYLVDHYPDFYLNMDLRQRTLRAFEVTRDEQDASRSIHQRAAAAPRRQFKDETVALNVTLEELTRRGRSSDGSSVDKDEGVCRDIRGILAKPAGISRKRNNYRGNASQCLIAQRQQSRLLNARRRWARNDGAVCGVCDRRLSAREMGIGPCFDSKRGNLRV